MKRSDIITKLVKEGFSSKTLVNMNDKQLNLLSVRILNEQISYGTVGSVDAPVKNIPKANAGAINQAKRNKETFLTYEQQIEEKKKPSAGLSKEKKSSIVKKAKEGKDIGKPGKNFEKVEKAAKKSGARDPKAVAAAAMWKNIQREEEIKEEKKWIQKAIKKPGALHKQLGVPEDEKIPASKLSAAAKKGGKLGKRARLAKTLRNLNENKIKTKKDITNWVENLVENRYISVTTKNEIMEAIQTKLSEQIMSPAPPAPAPVKEPKIKPDVDPGKTVPDKSPGKRPLHDPFKRPGPLTNPDPKYEEGNELPEFLSSASILGTTGNEMLNEETVNYIVSMVMDKIKKSLN